MKNPDAEVQIELSGQLYLLRHDFNAICTLQKCLGLENTEFITPALLTTALGMRSALYAQLGVRNSEGKFVHLSKLGRISEEMCGEFFDDNDRDYIFRKVAEAMTASQPKADPDPNAQRAEVGNGEKSSS